MPSAWPLSRDPRQSFRSAPGRPRYEAHRACTTAPRAPQYSPALAQRWDTSGTRGLPSMPAFPSSRLRPYSPDPPRRRRSCMCQDSASAHAASPSCWQFLSSCDLGVSALPCLGAFRQLLTIPQGLSGAVHATTRQTASAGTHTAPSQTWQALGPPEWQLHPSPKFPHASPRAR